MGLLTTFKGLLNADEHPVEELVNIKVVLPFEIPVTKPPLLTVATVGLELVHVPPVTGAKDVVVPAQIVTGPVIDVDGTAAMFIANVASPRHSLDPLFLL